eukprot:31316-Pelagococcus_subviridis.AAC.31
MIYSILQQARARYGVAALSSSSTLLRALWLIDRRQKPRHSCVSPRFRRNPPMSAACRRAHTGSHTTALAR